LPLTVVIVVAVLILALLWQFYWRPLTMVEVMNRVEWESGDVRTLEAQIVGVEHIRTTYGPFVVLDLDDGLCGMSVFEDPAKEFHVGDTYRVDLHFDTFTVNGIEGVWTRQLACPIPGLLMSMEVVMDAVSYVAGSSLVLAGTDESGWVTYEFRTPSGDRYHPAHIPVVLASGVEVWDQAWEDSNGGYRDGEVDRMDSLADGKSTAGRIRYVDVDGDGWVGDFDRLEVLVPPTPNAAVIETYMLIVGGGLSGGSYTSALKYIVNREQGPLELVGQSEDLHVQLVHVRDAGDDPVTSFLRVESHWGADPRSTGDYSVVFRDLAGRVVVQFPLTEATASTPEGIVVDYVDIQPDGLLNAGDELVVQGLENRTRMALDLRTNISSATLGWTTGVGHISGRLPSVVMEQNVTEPGRVDLEVPNWHPETALGGRIEVTLTENGTLILQASSLADGLVGSFGNGSLTFTDADADGFLSTGDYFNLTGPTGPTYELTVTLVHTHERTLEFTLD
jgi:hypothetical protein